jgi:hypothetical protein
MTTPKTVHLFRYNQASEACDALQRSLNRRTNLGEVRSIRHEGSTYKGGPNRVIINWGFSGRMPETCYLSRIINHPDNVRLASNKLNFFRAVTIEGGPRVPDWTTEKHIVASWLASGETAFARTVLNGHSGAGIVDVTELSQLDAIPDGTLFTKYVPKKTEWRVHVGFGRAFLTTRKVRPVSRETPVEVYNINWRIRNHDNGFIFERDYTTKLPSDVPKQACIAINKLGLDFGAVDVVYNEKREKAYVLEVNTAPGIEGSTIENYCEMFERNIT